MGRKPKPVALKKLQGNPGRQSLPFDEEPRSKLSLPRPPAYLCPEEKAQFKLMAAKLYKARVVTDMDVSLLTLYAESWWRHVQASNEVRKSGITYITHTGVIRQNPAVTIASKTQDQMFRILIELGMTPSARNKVHVVEGEGGDALDALARKRQDILK